MQYYDIHLIYIFLSHFKTFILQFRLLIFFQIRLRRESIQKLVQSDPVVKPVPSKTGPVSDVISAVTKDEEAVCTFTQHKSSLKIYIVF